ncbi:HNH endonuclease [Asticcacaulis sp. ZE23SCel15]|uniref:HNH endonuclease n=1 Tax=Asticcacaulis sp. ZE23SCel15 TaxID=3059027 RepID=UPI00265EF934|nr:HNH endonuclease [Asticcacaulis sp. ZE23SCel15]WKL57251.1 HNH endonuclease [Asticcacaulis sp. ZE23SCel15]
MASGLRGAQPWRAWYKTRRWQALRQEVLTRDALVCQMCGRLCVGLYPADNSPVADHKVEHRGDERLFWDIANIQTVCKSPCHDRDKQRAEQATLMTRGVWD